MNSVWLRLIVLVSLLVTAGCFGLLGDRTTRPESAPASTATPKPSQTPLPSPSAESSETTLPNAATIPLLSLVNESGIESADQFADRHDKTLRNTSFTIRYSRVFVQTGIETPDRRTVGVIRYDGNVTVYHNYTIIEATSGSTTRRRVRVWSNGTTARRAITTENETTVEVIPPIPVPTFADRVAIYLRSFETSVTGYSQLGAEPVIRVSGSDINRSKEQPTADNVAFEAGLVEIDRSRFLAVLTPGNLRRYRVVIIGNGRDGPALVREQFVLLDVGGTTVPCPS